MTIEIELFDGTVIEFPEGTDPAVMDRVAKSETASRQAQTSDDGATPQLGSPVTPPPV